MKEKELEQFKIIVSELLQAAHTGELINPGLRVQKRMEKLLDKFEKYAKLFLSS